MSAINVGGELVHYEVLGRGRTVILLHGWLGSWRYWIPLMRQLQLRYRVYAVDLFGYGDSGKNPQKYTINQQVNLVFEFMKQLGIEKAGMIAHGLGAHVITEFARHYPDKAVRLLLVSAPLFDPGDLATRVHPSKKILLTPQKTRHNKPKDEDEDINQPLASKPGSEPIAAHSAQTVPSRPEGLDALLEARLKEAEAAADDGLDSPTMIERERLRQAALARGSAILRGEDKLESPQRTATLPQVARHNPLREAIHGDLESLLLKCFKRSDSQYDKLHSDIPRIDNRVLDYVTRDFDAGMLLDTLHALPMPIIIAHGKNDALIPTPTEEVWEYLSADKEERYMMAVPFDGVGHFPMLESDSFNRLVGGFLEHQDISKIQLKERWMRRTR